MKTIRKNWFGRCLSLLLALIMCLGIFGSTAYAATPVLEPTTPVEKIDVPVEDGVYYADIELLQAANPKQFSMGNAALRGSTSFKQKQPDDTYYKSLVVVKDNRATAIVEFMPMGYIGMYGFMMELESVDVEYLQQWGSVYDKSATFTPAMVLARHMTISGETVYDPFNDPDSNSVFNGNKIRPAGFGYDSDRNVDISDQPYSHILALDVTPIHIKFAKDDPGVPSNISEYGINNAAYVHVFVPVMFSISASSGDQYARMKVDWTSLERIEEPEKNLQYVLWSAKQVEQGNYTDFSYAALQKTICEITTKLENIWPNQTISMNGTGFNAQPKLEQKEYSDSETSEMTEKLNAAVAALELKGEKETLNSLIERGNLISESIYTAESYAEMSEALVAAIAVQKNTDAGVSEVDKAVEILSGALESMVYKDADYSAVDAALEKIPVDLSGYTEESAKFVTAAKDAVIRGKNITEQDAVDAMAKRIEDAVSALEEKKVSEEPDRKNLADGVYSIYGEMIKVNRQDTSMSNDAINHMIKLTVENGEYYLTIDFHGLHYLNRFGYLANLSYYDNGYTYGLYGKIEGTRIPAKILSTQKDSEGKDIIDEFNQVGGSSEGVLYPDQLRFKLVSDALNDEGGYVPLHVFVPVMEDISEGTGEQDVLLKLDWSTLKETTEDDPVFRPEPPVELSPEVDITDDATGVKVHADKGVFEEGVKLVVNEITMGLDYDNAVSALAEVGKKFKLYEIHFEDSDGNEVQPNGTVSVSCPILSGYDAANVVLYRINYDGTKTLIKGTVDGNYYTVITKSFSNYALVEKDTAITDHVNSDGPQIGVNAPQTGDNTNLVLWFLFALASAGMLAVLLRRKRRDASKGY